MRGAVRIMGAAVRQVVEGVVDKGLPAGVRFILIPLARCPGPGTPWGRQANTITRRELVFLGR